jgi:CHAD domain-containing protein
MLPLYDRLTTVLELGRPVLGRFRAGEVRRAVRCLLRESSDLRDEEVLLHLIAPLAGDGLDVQRWIASRRQRERRLRSVVRRGLTAGPLDDSRHLIGALVAFRVDPSKDKRLGKFARRAVEAARREVERVRAEGIDDAQALHRLRIAYKRLRYAVETFASVLPADLAALAQPAARLQSRLGDLHDVDVAIACVGRARLLSDAGRQAVLAALARLRGQRAAACEAELGAPPGSVSFGAQLAGGESLRKSSMR